MNLALEQKEGQKYLARRLSRSKFQSNRLILIWDQFVQTMSG